VIVATGGSVFNFALIFHFFDDPSALKVVRIIGMAISVGVGIGGALACRCESYLLFTTGIEHGGLFKWN
jgi:hypothetical protein